MRSEQPGEHGRVQAFEIFQSVAHLERRLEVQQRSNVTQGPRKIEEHSRFPGDLSQLHGQIHGDRAGSHATFRTQHHKQLAGDSPGRSLGRVMAADSRNQGRKFSSVVRFLQKIAHARTHCAQQEFRARLSFGGAGNNVGGRPQPGQLLRKSEIGFPAAAQIQKNDFGNVLRVA